MNYFKIYCNIIDKRIIEPAFTTEKYIGEYHHIIPKSLNNNNNVLNIFKKYQIGKIVTLTYKEHYITHCLLVKIFENIDKQAYYKMWFAWNRMATDGRHRSWEYVLFKKRCHEVCSTVQKEYFNNTKNKEKISICTKKAMNRLEVKEKLMCAIKKRWSNPEEKIKQQKRMHSLAYKEKLKKYWGNPKNREKSSIRQKEINNRPEVKEKHRISMNIYWSNPKNREKVSGKNNKNIKTVICYDLKGNFIKEYIYLGQVEEEHYNLGAVSKCCHNKYGKHKNTNIYKNRIWKFKDSDIIEQKIEAVNKLVKCAKPVLKFDLDNNLIKEYNSMSETHIDGYNSKIVSKCCYNIYKEKGNIYKNFIWKFKR